MGRPVKVAAGWPSDHPRAGLTKTSLPALSTTQRIVFCASSDPCVSRLCGIRLKNPLQAFLSVSPCGHDNIKGDFVDGNVCFEYGDVFLT